MKNKAKKLYTYQFPLGHEIESCCTCPASEQHPDYNTIECKILKATFELDEDDNFPDNCPMEETNLPENFGHR
jgi:hypothetical protein